MKHLVLVLALLSNSVLAQEKPLAEYVKETLEFCQDIPQEEEPTNADLLECINTELEAEQFQTFATLHAVMAFIEHLKD